MKFYRDIYFVSFQPRKARKVVEKVPKVAEKAPKVAGKARKVAGKPTDVRKATAAPPPGTFVDQSDDEGIPERLVQKKVKYHSK